MWLAFRLLIVLVIGSLCGCGVKSHLRDKMTKEDFKKMVDGKTFQEVETALGKPDAVEKGADSEARSDDDVIWAYGRVIRDPLTKEVFDARITFSKRTGKVVGEPRFFVR